MWQLYRLHDTAFKKAITNTTIGIYNSFPSPRVKLECYSVWRKQDKTITSVAPFKSTYDSLRKFGDYTVALDSNPCQIF